MDVLRDRNAPIHLVDVMNYRCWRNRIARQPLWVKFVVVGLCWVVAQYVIQAGVLRAGWVYWQQEGWPVTISDSTSFPVNALIRIEDMFYMCASEFELNDVNHGHGWVPLEIKDGVVYLPAEGSFTPDTLCAIRSIDGLSGTVDIKAWPDLESYFDSLEGPVVHATD